MTDKNDFAIIDEINLSNFKKIRFKPNFVFFKIIENILKLLKKLYYKIKNLTNFIILAAGRGSRLKNTTKNIPKGLVEINSNNTILDYQINILTKYKNSKIFIVVGYK